MSLMFDHLVHQVPSPEETKAFLNERGIHTVNGGKHTMWGTYNTLSYFGLSYIEQIAVYDRTLFEKAAKLPYSLHHTFKQQDEQFGFSRIALRTTAIDREAVRLRALGFDVYGPDVCSRTRQDGTVVEWKLLHFGKPNLAIDFPFLIEWADEDDVRLAQLENSGAWNKQQVMEMTSISFMVKDVGETVSLWQEVFELPQTVDGDVTSLHLPNLRLDFYNEDHMLTDLKQGPFVVTLTNHTKEKQTIMFPHGLYLLNP